MHRAGRDREPGRHRVPRGCGHLTLLLLAALLIAGLLALALRLAI